MASSLYPVRFPDQLRQHLRALRRARGLTQAQLGVLLGVSQARVAEIEAHPAAVSVEQLMRVLALLNVHLALQENARDDLSHTGKDALQDARQKSTALDTTEPPRPVPETTTPHSKPAETPVPENEAQSGTRRKMLIRPRKGSW